MDRHFTHCLIFVFQLAKQKILNAYFLIGATKINGETSQTKLLPMGVIH